LHNNPRTSHRAPKFHLS